MSHENPNRTAMSEEPHAHSMDGDATLGEEFMDCCYWDKALKEKMRRTVTPRAEDCYTAKQTRNMVALAWFENPRRPVIIPQWDEAAKEKMRERKMTNSDHNTLDDASIKHLIELAGF
jgi:hypothetical protein